MSLRHRRCYIVGIWLVASFSITRPAKSDLIVDISVSVTPQPGGLNLYQYTITDEAASSLPTVEFTLAVDPTANLTSIMGPNDWVLTYSTGDSLVDWSSLSSSTDLQPGNSAIFSFVSPLGSIEQDYQILGLTVDPFQIGASQGQIAAPGISSVPEPGSLILLGIGALEVGTILAWRSRRRASSSVTRLAVPA